jgi:hypothetical protein
MNEATKGNKPMPGGGSKCAVFGGLMLLAGGLLMSGCAALLPAGSMVGPLLGATPPLQVTDLTNVKLARDNFVLVKANVVGRSKGFSLLGFITICPATVTTAMNRLYAAAQMRPGEPQTMAHLTVERSSSYWVLFGIPQVEVRADVVKFIPKAKNK